MMPKESMILQLSESKYGEYYSLYNNEEPNESKQSKFIKNNIINNFWKLPNNKEILRMDIPLE